MCKRCDSTNQEANLAEDLVVCGSKRHSLQAVELSQTSVQIVSKPSDPSNGGPIYRLLCKPVMRTRWMAGAIPHRSG